MDSVAAVPGRLKLKKGSGVLKKAKKKTNPLDSGLAGKLSNKVPRSSQEEDVEIDRTKYVKKLKLDGDDVPESAAPPDVDAREEDAFKLPPKTKAQISFEERQKKLQADRIFKKAQMSHREKVEQFNEHLNELTEFNDIPKVSWTK